MEMLLYVIILGLVLNLLANMLWKYLPTTGHIDVWSTVVLVAVCILLQVYHRGAGASPKTQAVSQNPEEQLVEIIKQQQRQYVRESCGELAHECFTEADLNQFIVTNVPRQICAQLKLDRKFIGVFLAIKKMSTSDRKNITQSCLKICRPTWMQMHKVSCEGQTEAGQKAELLIAKAIVGLMLSES